MPVLGGLLHEPHGKSSLAVNPRLVNKVARDQEDVNSACNLSVLLSSILTTTGPAQVSVERTIGTVCGGLLGLGISLLGHGFGQDSDMLFTGTGVSLVRPIPQSRACR